MSIESNPAGESFRIRVGGVQHPVEARLIARHVVGGRTDDPVYVVAARTCRDGRLWERLVLSHRTLAAAAV